MKTTITLTRVYAKSVKIEIEPNLFKGMSHEMIADFILDNTDVNSKAMDKEFNKAELYDVECIDGKTNLDDDRFDIYENGKQVYGGHL